MAKQKVIIKNTPFNKYLIFDVGMHKGEDTNYYLKKGFNVIAFEADPDLVQYCQNKFVDEIKSGQLVIVSGAIVDRDSMPVRAKSVKFYKNNQVSFWGTVSTEWTNRNHSFWTSHQAIKVLVVDFSDYLSKYGVPYYMKIDIEGMDAVCLKTLRQFTHKPPYLSIETAKNSLGQLVEEINLLHELGYNQFQVINQAEVSGQKEPNPSMEKRYVGHSFPKEASGLFGQDLPNKWLDYRQIFDAYQKIFFKYALFGDKGFFGRTIVGKLLIIFFSNYLSNSTCGWHDIHAKHSTIAN